MSDSELMETLTCSVAECWISPKGLLPGVLGRKNSNQPLEVQIIPLEADFSLEVSRLLTEFDEATIEMTNHENDGTVLTIKGRFRGEHLILHVDTSPAEYAKAWESLQGALENAKLVEVRDFSSAVGNHRMVDTHR